MNNDSKSAKIIAHEAIPYQEGDINCPALSCQAEVSHLTCLVGPYRSQLRSYLLMLAGISRPKQGVVDILGHNISQLNHLEWRNLRCQVGYFSGASPLLSTQHGLMNVMLPALYHTNLSHQAVAEKATELLKQLNCHFDLSAFPALLNNFERAQLAFARALILEPQLLIWDVPFYDLGAKEREKMGALLGEYIEGHTVCMIGGLQYTHFLKQHANQIIFISGHKIIKFNGWSSFSQTEDPEVKMLLSVL